MTPPALRPAFSAFSACLTAAAIVLSVVAPRPLAGQGSDTAPEIIQPRVEQLRAGQGLAIGESEIASVIVLPALYERRSFTPLWTDRQLLADLMRAIAASESDGLDPGDYHAEALESLMAGPAMDAEAVADLDMLATDALVRLGYHLLFGKVDPERLNPNWNLIGDLNDLDPVVAIETALASGRLFDVIEGYKPQDPFYVDLKAALAEYREIAERGGWEPVPASGLVELGDSSAVVSALRRRLAITGELDGSDPADPRFDDTLDEAVKAFQARHGLAVDGRVGRNTYAALNVPVERRIDQIRINLERGRWALRQLKDDFLIVNIAAFEVYKVENREIVWSTRAMVGRPYRRTPIFTADLQYLVFNPTWTVPPTILRQDVLPAIRRDRGYLARNNMKVLTRSGREVDPARVNWAEGASFPYIIRQEPSPGNALGQVKFIFPNDHFVFLHDTPNRALFDRTVRTFSSGCIRVENPMLLAELILDDPDEWNAAAIDGVLDSRRSRTVHLEEPLQVLLAYWTAWVEPGGPLTFYGDVYERDAPILESLAGEFQFRERQVVPAGDR